MIEDLVTETRRASRGAAPRSADDIRARREATVAFSPAMAATIARLKAFLFERVYRHAARHARDARRRGASSRDLFARYWPIPPHAGGLATRHSTAGRRQRARLIADFVAGMTDRYAIAEHRRLFDATPDLR